MMGSTKFILAILRHFKWLVHHHMVNHRLRLICSFLYWLNCSIPRLLLCSISDTS